MSYAIDAITKDGEIIPLSPGLGLRGRVLRVGWDLPPDLTEPEWREAGELLGKVEHSISWWLGDWWRFGERYGNRVDIVTAPDWEGPVHGTCRNAAVVCGKFSDVSRRRDTLTFNHHAEVAILEPDEADTLLDWCEEPEKPRSTRELRGEVSRRRTTLGAQPSLATCTITDLNSLIQSGEKFGCIYADPPWSYDNQATRAATGNHYQSLTVAQLCELPVRKFAADNAHLHLWTTNAFLFSCPDIFAAWGFEFRSSFVWIKPQMGIGNYWRNSHEILLTAIRGDAKRFNDHSLKSWLECDRGAHSAKPEQVRSMIERSSPGPFLEMFARREAPGWTVWGNQIERNIFTRSAAE